MRRGCCSPPPTDFEPFDARRAREIYLEALSAAVFAGRLAVACDAREVAAAARALPEPPTPPAAADLLLDGLARMITEGPVTGTPAVRHALRAFGSGDIGADEGQRWWRWLAGRAAGFIWDYEAWDSLTLRQIRAAREAGALAELPFALSTRVGVCLFGGDVAAASSLLEESNGLAEATGSQIVPPYGSLTVAAFRGRDDELTTIRRDDDRGVPPARRGDGAHALALGDRRSLQRSGAVRGCVRGGRSGHRGSTRAVVLELRAGRVDRGGQSRSAGRTARPRRSRS